MQTSRFGATFTIVVGEIGTEKFVSMLDRVNRLETSVTEGVCSALCSIFTRNGLFMLNLEEDSVAQLLAKRYALDSNLSDVDDIPVTSEIIALSMDRSIGEDAPELGTWQFKVFIPLMDIDGFVETIDLVTQAVGDTFYTQDEAHTAQIGESFRIRIENPDLNPFHFAISAPEIKWMTDGNTLGEIDIVSQRHLMAPMILRDMKIMGRESMNRRMVQAAFARNSGHPDAATGFDTARRIITLRHYSTDQIFALVEEDALEDLLVDMEGYATHNRIESPGRTQIEVEHLMDRLAMATSWSDLNAGQLSVEKDIVEGRDFRDTQEPDTTFLLGYMGQAMAAYSTEEQAIAVFANLNGRAVPALRSGSLAPSDLPHIPALIMLDLVDIHADVTSSVKISIWNEAMSRSAGTMLTQMHALELMPMPPAPRAGSGDFEPG